MRNPLSKCAFICGVLFSAIAFSSCKSGANGAVFEAYGKRPRVSFSHFVLPVTIIS